MTKAQKVFLISLILMSVLLVSLFLLLFLSNDTTAFADGTHTINWLNYDGTLIYSEQVADGDTPSYSGTTPEKPEDVGHTYSFIGWDPEIGPALDDCDYTAKFSSSAKSYNVSIYDNDLEGTPTCVSGEYDSYVYDILEAKEVAFYYIYYNSDMSLFSYDTKITGDISIIRKEAYQVNIRKIINDVHSSTTSTLYLKDASIDLSTLSTDPKYDYSYYAYDIEHSTQADQLEDLNVVLNTCTYIEDDNITFNQRLNSIKVQIKNGQDTSQTKQVNYLEEYGALFEPEEMTGYSFLGWYYGTKLIQPTTIVSTKVTHTLTANYKANSYNVTFKYPDRDKVVQISYGTNFGSIDVPKKTGYTFVSWQLNGDNFDLTAVYSIPNDIELIPKFTPNTYRITYTLEDYEYYQDIVFDSENISLKSDAIFAYLEKNFIIGALYVENAKDTQLCDSSLIVDKWTIAKNITVYFKTISKNKEVLSKFEVPDMSLFEYKFKLDSNIVDQDTDIKVIGNHEIQILDSSDNVIYTQDITIKEDFAFVDGGLYQSPIYLANIDAVIFVDDVFIEDLVDARIDKAGTHTIKVLGANGYENTYEVTYDNKNLSKGWWVFGISTAIMLGVLVVAIIGRRKVVKYYAEH